MIEVYQNKTLYIIDNQILGEIDYPNINSSTVNITHTFVDPSLRGQGIADKMMNEVFKYLQKIYTSKMYLFLCDILARKTPKISWFKSWLTKYFML